MSAVTKKIKDRVVLSELEFDQFFIELMESLRVRLIERQVLISKVRAAKEQLK